MGRFTVVFLKRGGQGGHDKKGGLAAWERVE